MCYAFMNEAGYMRMAIEKAREGQTPFGAVVVTDRGNVFAAHNATDTRGVMAHAETEALRACGDEKPRVMYSTCEPCPMCMGAILWHKMNTVYFGADIRTISKYLPQIMMPSREIAERGFGECEIIPGILAEECEQLLIRYA